MTYSLRQAYTALVSQHQSFIGQLETRWNRANTRVCVGLDPNPSKFPPHVRDVLEFCKKIVRATAPFVCAFKPQVAYFSALGYEDELVELISWIHENFVGIPIILDAKRGDIGSTAELYAKEAFERYKADAVTVNPYLGEESIRPFLDYDGKGIFLLCRTSNKGSSWLQNYPNEEPIYLRVAKKAADIAKKHNVMLVVGATYPEDLMRVRSLVGDMPILVPGIGAQGGDLQATIANGGNRLILNSSRGIIYAGASENFEEEVAAAARALRDNIKKYIE